MRRSVSMLGRSRGTALAVSVVNASIVFSPSQGSGGELPDVGEPAGDGGGRGHGRAHEMCAGTLPLAPLEVAIGRGGHALALTRGVAVDAHAHGTARIAPLEAGRGEDRMQT